MTAFLRSRSLLATASIVTLLLTVPSSAQAKKKATVGPDMTLIEAGRGKKTPLRYTYKKGARTTWKVRVESNMKLSGRSMPVPQVLFESDLNVVAVDSKGTATCKFALSEAKIEALGNVPAKTLEGINAKLAPLKKVTGKATFDSRGRLVSYKRDPNKAVSEKGQLALLLASFDQQFRQATVPLPKDPVGKGARWKVTHKVVSNDITLNQENVYSLLERDGRKGTHTLAITIRQSAPAQVVKLPGVPPNMETRLLSADGEGKSKVTIMPDRVGAHGTSSVELALAIEMKMGKQSGKAALKLNTKVALLAGIKSAPKKKK